MIKEEEPISVHNDALVHKINHMKNDLEVKEVRTYNNH